MSIRTEKLAQWLFETRAIKVSPKDRPFWYTSGTIGPYYVNTHFLFGGEEKAEELLASIDRLKDDKLSCPGEILARAKENYQKDPVYRGTIEELASLIKEEVDLQEIDFISGGERRDWFFSLMAASVLGKPHISIYKDLSAVVLKEGKASYTGDLKGSRVLHVADIITQASSFTNAWLPAIAKAGGQIRWAAVVADRLQGGAESLEKQGVKPLSLVKIDLGLFEKALERGLIERNQYELVANYIKDPFNSMRAFLLEHPEFLRESLNSDERTAGRARVCLEMDLYRLGGSISLN